MLFFSLVTLTFKLVRARDQTRLPREFGANPFSGSRDISCTNKETTDWWRKQHLPQFTACGNKKKFQKAKSNTDKLYHTKIHAVKATNLVSWSLTSLFSTNKAIPETKGQGWKVIRTQWRKASDILTSTLAAFLFSSHPKKGKGSRGSFKLLCDGHKTLGNNMPVPVLRCCRQGTEMMWVTPELNASVFSLSECAQCHQQGHMGSKTLL